MNLTFDFIVADKNKFKTLNHEELKVIYAISDKVAELLLPLLEEIDFEELDSAVNGLEKKFISIPYEDELGIIAQGYSKGLTRRIEALVTFNELNQIRIGVRGIVKEFRN